MKGSTGRAGKTPSATAGAGPGAEIVVELPELFGPPGGRGPGDRGGGAGAGTEAAPLPRVVMVTGKAHAGTFLGPVFAREGRELVIAGELEALAAELAAGPVESILVSTEMLETFREWVRGGRLGELPAPVTTFSSVSESLIANAAPYGEMARSLRAAVEALADARARGGDAPPYGVLARDVEELAGLERLSRLATDGLYLTVHLLTPPRPVVGAGARTKSVPAPFGEFSRSREIAVRLRFPWPIEEVLDTCLALFFGAPLPVPPEKADPEVLQGARILALVWYHRILAPAAGDDVKDEVAMRARLRRVARRLATLDLAEKYIGILEERRAAGALEEPARVILVGGDRVVDLGARLNRSGIHTILTRDLADAQAMAERRSPAAVIVDREAAYGKVEQFARVAKLSASLLLYVVTDSTDPAVTLSLLDAGVDDVLAPPHDFQLAAARITRAIASRSRARSQARARSGDFSASFQAFSFLDLVQALANGRKSVRVELRRPGTGEAACLFLEHGIPVHATCGEAEGPEAVYRIIAWEDDGEFTVYPESFFPPPTIDLPLESLLMEGCRRLDESRRPA